METKPPIPLAVLVGIQTSEVDDVAHDASLEELGRLVKTLGYEVVGIVSQKREGTGAGSLLGSGKLAELAAMTGGTGVIGSMAPPPNAKARLRFDGVAAAVKPAGPASDEPDSGAPASLSSSSSIMSSRPARSATSSALPALRCWTAPASSSRYSTATPIPARQNYRWRWRG